MKALKLSLIVLCVLASLAFAAATTFEKMITQKVIRQAVECLAKNLDDEILRDAGDCARYTVYEGELGEKWYDGDYKAILEAARAALSNPRALKILYRVHKSMVIREIKRHEGLGEKLLPHLTDLRKYFVPGGLPQELATDLQKRRQLEQAWEDALKADNQEAIRRASTESSDFDHNLASRPVKRVVIKNYEWPLRREKEGGEQGKELVAAWLWIVDDFAKALK